jgi:hypothetical protein
MQYPSHRTYFSEPKTAFGSNIGRATGYSDKYFVVSLTISKRKPRPRLPPSKFIPTHNYHFPVSFDSMRTSWNIILRKPENWLVLSPYVESTRNLMFQIWNTELRFYCLYTDLSNEPVLNSTLRFRLEKGSSCSSYLIYPIIHSAISLIFL